MYRLPPDMKSWLTREDYDADKDWRQKEKGMTGDVMIGWGHRIDGHEFEQAPGVGDEQGRLVCCSPWSPKDLDMMQHLNWTEHTSIFNMDNLLGHTLWHRELSSICDSLNRRGVWGRMGTWMCLYIYVCVVYMTHFIYIYNVSLPLLFTWNYQNFFNWLYWNTR